MKKAFLCDLGPIYDKNWNALQVTRKQALAYGWKHIDKSLKAVGFEPVIFGSVEYFRLNYGKERFNYV